MINRYCLDKMKQIWEMQSNFEYYLKVELAVCEAYAQMGEIPLDALEQIKRDAKFDLKRIDEIEAEVHHDVIAFLTCVNEGLGENAKYMHKGLTSSDVIDTAYALQFKDASQIISDDLVKVIVTLKAMAKKYKDTVCIGRSHGIHAEVTTFGVKLLNWVDSFERACKNFLIATEDITMGQISGRVGTYSNVPMEVETLTCENLGLKSARISTQVISRDVYARYMNELAMIATVVEQFATEIRNLQRTEVREVEEGFSKKQKGSSAMPHKKNPVLSENLCGLARVVRNNVNTAMENIVLWHERDISHSSAERIITPDTTILMNYMLNRFGNIVKNLTVFPENMIRNMNSTFGLIYSQRVMLKLIEKGMTRETAYDLVQPKTAYSWDNQVDFKPQLLSDEQVMSILTKAEIDELFDPTYYASRVEEVFERIGL